MNKSIKNSLHIFALTASSLVFYSCTETWDDHYKESVATSHTLWEQIEQHPELDNFAQVLQATKISSGTRLTEVSYATLLAGDQSFTVWVPQISAATRDSLIALCNTPEGTMIVEKSFVKNHVARYNHSISSSTNQQITLYNKKVQRLTNTHIGDATLINVNIVTKNGVMHTIDRNIPYFSNLYEYLRDNNEFSSLSRYIMSFQKDSLDEEASVKGEIIDGQYMYVDSVMIEKNILLNSIGLINTEDSLYMVLAPTNKAWDSIYTKIADYYNYGRIDNADSLQRHYTQYAIVNDIIFNQNLQRSPQDSLISNPYTSREPDWHVFYNPYDEGGIFSKAGTAVECSNGTIHAVDEWPFKFTETFLRPITMEAERESDIRESSLCSYYIRESRGDSVSRNRFLDIVPATSAANPTITFQISNTLSGTYDICVVCVPKTAFNENSTDFRPYQFRALLSYVNERGVTVTNNAGNKSFNNDPYRMDTVCVMEKFTFPTCDYGQEIPNVTLRLQSYITSSQTTLFSRQMYIDCIYLIPRED